jgi:hypothetical protein
MRKKAIETLFYQLHALQLSLIGTIKSLVAGSDVIGHF